MKTRVLSGMRPTGRLHLGHLCGVLNKWLELQQNHDCFFFVADWHALTTSYIEPPDLHANTYELVLTWLAAGLDPSRAVIFVQSKIPQHAELYVLLSMLCPLSKLLQMPTYKDQKNNLQQNLDTYGFLGYPLLQTADILAYRAKMVPVGQDQVPHIEFSREIARRVNYFYGRGEDFKHDVEIYFQQLPKEKAQAIQEYVVLYRHSGKEEALQQALTLLESEKLSEKAQAVLRGYCLYDACEILPTPEYQLSSFPSLLGTDGRKMSKSYDNTIDLFDNEAVIKDKILRMKTDPARGRRQDKGHPEHCPVWSLHKSFSDVETQEWVFEGCTSAGIGCVDCKKRLNDNLQQSLEPLLVRRTEIEKSGMIHDILAEGNVKATQVAEETLSFVRSAMRLS